MLQKAIFFTLINEYTDWTKTGEQGHNLIDSLIDLLSDALVVAPSIETIDHHYIQSLLMSTISSGKLANGKQLKQLFDSVVNKLTTRCYFYVFAYQVCFETIF